MADIVHTVQMHASPAAVFHALIDRSGSHGWHRETKTKPRMGALTDFRFGDGKVVVKMRVAALEEDARVALQCVEGPADWVGTSVTFELAPEGDETVVHFGHRNWREATDRMGRSSAMWAHILFALKSLLETPEPEDLYV